MLEQAAKDLGMTLKDFEDIYVIGNRKNDAKTGINAGGKGIFVRHRGSDSQYEKVQRRLQKYSGRLFIADNFLEAARIIIN